MTTQKASNVQIKTSDDQFDDAYTDPSTNGDEQIDEAEGGKRDPDERTRDNTANEEVASRMSSQSPPTTEESTVPKVVPTWDDVFGHRPQTPTPDEADMVTSGLNSMQIQEVHMEDVTDLHSDTSSETASSISAHIIKLFEDEPPMDNMTEWVK